MLHIDINHNYGLVGEALGIDLINNPELVATNPIVSFKTAIWFWMTRPENKPSGQESSLGVVARSIGYYKRYCGMLEVSYGDGTPNFLDGSRI
ncbi:hypothetical protein TIFTF001_016244 [Ficus carica]|uniref:Glycoside hydrolase family 19 catalytic domain-containing protein n=1 Tax=Ficus carica TaxID=3494 RepID=A0AA88AA96_FICCA|nr:hypothetical protein TIFTF001_016244 [Ficus carica]